MTRWLRLLTAFALCAGLTALTFAPAQAQQRERRARLESQRRAHEESTAVQATGPSHLQQAVLIDQTSEASPFSGTGSHEFAPGSANAVFNAEAADDFTVPAGGWDIAAVEALGLTRDDIGGWPILSITPSNVDIVIYNECADGFPCDNGAASDTAYAAYNVTPSFGGDEAGFFVNLPSPASLSAGTYWLSVVVDQDFDDYGGQWIWSNRYVPNGSQAVFKEPNSPAPDACNTWGFFDDCPETSIEDDSRFETTAGNASTDAAYSWSLPFALYDTPFTDPPPNLSVQPEEELVLEAVTGTADSDTITISNAAGTGDLVVSDLQITGLEQEYFAISDAPSAPFTIPGGASEDIVITAHPDRESNLATFEITSNDDGAAGTLTTVELVGTGLDSLDYPYTVDFDGGPNSNPGLPSDWEAPPGPDYETWEADDAGDAPGQDYGADDDHTTPDFGGEWAWLDDSFPDGAPNNLVVRLLDFSDLLTPRLTFWYQNAVADTDPGAEISDLYVDVSSDGGAPYDTNLFSITERVEGWTQYSVDLTAYAGEPDVKIRFRAVESSGYQSNPSLDDVTVEEAPGTPVIGVGPQVLDFGETSTASPVTANTQAVQITNTNGGALTVSALSVTGADAEAFSVVEAPVAPFDVAPGQTDTVRVGFAPSGESDYQATLEITSNSGSDPGAVSTVALEGAGVAPDGLFPYTVTFDGGLPPSWQAPGPGWRVNDHHREYETEFDDHGPDRDHTTEDGQWAFLREFPPVTGYDDLITRPLDLSSLSSPRLTFWYQDFGSDTDDAEIPEVSVDVSTDGGATYDTRLLWPIPSAGEWTFTTVDLSAYAGEGNVVIRFRADHTDFPSDTYFGGIPSIDDVTVEETPPGPVFTAYPIDGRFGTATTSGLESAFFFPPLFDITNTGVGPENLVVQEPSITGRDPAAFTLEDPYYGDYPFSLASGDDFDFEVLVGDTLSAGTYQATLSIPYDDGAGTTTRAVPLEVTVLDPDFGGPVAGYFYANSTAAAQNSDLVEAPSVVPLSIPPPNQTDVTSGLGAETVDGPFPIGFDFEFFGQTYNSFCIHSYGFISLQNGSGACLEEGPFDDFWTGSIPNGERPNNIIAWFWKDLDLNAHPSAEVLYGQDEDGGLIVSFENAVESDYTLDLDTYVSADVKLYPSDETATDGKVRIQFNDFGPAADTTEGVVGIESDSLDTSGNGIYDDIQGVEYRDGAEDDDFFDDDDDDDPSEYGGLLAGGDTLAVVFGPAPELSTDAVNIPVELANFTAAISDGGVTLSWETLSEENNRGFEVRMKRRLTAADGSSQPDHANEWQQVGFVESTAPGGTSTEAQTYQLRVPDLEVGDYTFRLRQVDLDGTPTLSDQTVEAQVGLEGQYELSGAYPNPFRDRATFEVAVKEAQDVTVEVYDVLGRRVMEVFDGWLEAGTAQTIQIEARGLASGVYFYRVSGEDFTASRKMMIVR